MPNTKSRFAFIPQRKGGLTRDVHKGNTYWEGIWEGQAGQGWSTDLGFCCEEEMDLVRVRIMWNGWSVVCVEFGYTSNVPTVKARRPLCAPLAAHQAASVNNKTTWTLSGLNKSCYYTVYSGVYPFNYVRNVKEWWIKKFTPRRKMASSLHTSRPHSYNKAKV